MDEESVNAVIDGAEYALSFAVLLGCVRASERQYGAMGFEETLVCGVIEIASIIGLKSLDGARELRANIGIE